MNDFVMQSEPSCSPVEHSVARAESSRRQPSHDEIARRAYEIYERSGCEPGHSLENWLHAELELHEEVWGIGPAMEPARDGSHR